MKTNYFLATLLCFFFTGAVYAQNEFITKWDTRLADATGTNATIRFGALGTGFTLSYEQQGGSGYTGTLTVNNQPIVTFPEAGVYIVKMSGLTGYSTTGDPSVANSPYSFIPALLEVQQWGNTHWTNLSRAFNGANNMDMTVTDVPDLSGVTDLSSMFSGCWNLINTNGSISSWNTGNITNMSNMFAVATKFNQPLNSWDVGKVTNMSYTFRGAFAFNQPLNSWDVSKVINMGSMFDQAIAFNQPLNNWDVSKVTNMSGMFSSAFVFNQPLNNWNVGSVTNMSRMFSSATAFNQPLNSWNVGSVTNMQSMFDYANYFNQPLDNWDVSKVTNMARMFAITQRFNQSLGAWNLNSLTNAATMFDGSGINCENYSLTLYGWANNTNTPSGVTLGAARITYGPAAVAAHTALTSAPLNWTINGDALGTCNVVLPVTFGAVNAFIVNNQLQVSWSTLTETNNNHFEIEASKDGNTFTKIGGVVSKAKDGNSDSAIQYDFSVSYGAAISAIFGLLLLGAGFKQRRKWAAGLLGVLALTLLVNACTKNDSHNISKDGKLFIRIKQVDKDGGFDYSKTVQAVVK